MNHFPLCHSRAMHENDSSFISVYILYTLTAYQPISIHLSSMSSNSFSNNRHNSWWLQARRLVVLSILTWNKRYKIKCCQPVKGQDFYKEINEENAVVSEVYFREASCIKCCRMHLSLLYFCFWPSYKTEYDKWCGKVGKH